MKNHSKNMKKHSKESSNDNLGEKVIYIIFELFFTKIIPLLFSFKTLMSEM